jgi:hypothetical protein
MKGRPMRAVAVFCVLLAGTASAEAQHFQKVAASGAPMMLYQAWSVNPDCSPTGTLTMRLVSAPNHGRVSIVRAKVFPRFPPHNPRHHCNARGVSGVKAMYVSRRGYTGPDTAAVEVIFPAGGYRRAGFGIAVR